jgi:ATP-dependent helicase HrpA
VLRDGEVDLRLFKQRDEVLKHLPAAVRKLAENALGKDIAWLWKELRHLTPGGAKPVQSFHNSLSALSLSKPATPQGSAEQLQKDAHEHILRHMLRLQPLLPLTEKRFVALCESVRKDLPLITHRVGDLLKQTQEWKQKLQALPKPYPGLAHDLHRLLPPDILARTPHQQLQHLPRYMKAMQVRAERFSHSPDKDAKKEDLIIDFDGWEKYVPESQHETFRWMMEEYRVTVFAPELGTAQPVSVKKLEAMMV